MEFVTVSKNSGQRLWPALALLTLKCKQSGPVNMAFTVAHRPAALEKFSLEQPEVLLARPASCMSTYCGALRWMGGRWEVVSHQHTMPPLGNVNTHSTWGQATSDWPEGPCKERYFGVPFIYSGQWKINMPVKSIFKNKREVSNLVLFVECKSVSCAIF